MKRWSLPLALLALAAVLLIGLPLFLRAPVWVDVTYHDVSAWNILHGGVHYRDVFETNLPGMVWLHALIRPVVGWSHEAIRLADLAVMGPVLGLLAELIRRARAGQEFPSPPGFGGGEGAGVRGAALAESGARIPTLLASTPLTPAPLPPQSRGERGEARPASLSAAVWFVVAAALFYLFETEFIHCQRDGWMMLPAVAATSLRVRRLFGAPTSRSVLEGVLWGLAVWIKPHVLVPAFAVWLVGLRFQTRRAVGVDALALVAGGLLAGIGGSLWLAATGAWGPMWDVLLHWNNEYYAWSWADLGLKVRLVSAYFGPFSLLHFAAVPLAVVAVCRREPVRAALAALYLGWLLQATAIQKPFDYAHAPPTLLGLAVLASFRWPVGPVFLGWCALAGLANELAGDALRPLGQAYPVTVRTALPHHSIARRDRLALWGRCWHDGSWELKDRLTFYRELHCAPDWADLARVADFLRTKDLNDRDLICWHDSTHPLYVWLGVRPGIRYPHVITAMKFRSRRDQIRAEAFASPARYVVSDLVPVEYLTPLGPPPPPGPAHTLPPGFPAWGADVYPWNQPVVFRAGRYVVHEITDPRGEIDFPLPDGLWDQ